MKIPIQLSFKLFEETTTVKNVVYDLHIGDTMDMYRKVMIPLFGEENYENTILQLANKIQENRSKKIRPSIEDIIRRKRKPLLVRIFKWVDKFI